MAVAALLVAATVAWLATVAAARHMSVMPGTMGLGLAPFLAVWALMMAAMMLPSIVPVGGLYARTVVSARGPRLATFAVGYLLVWLVAGVPAFGLAWLAGRASGTHPRLASAMAAGLFVVCGLYQLTPLKDRCLARCRSSLALLFRYSSYRGRLRDVRVGAHHAAYCVGCCWSLMLLLVAFGLMNVLAMIALAAVVVLEKVSPSGRTVARLAGGAALVMAVVVIVVPALAPGLVSG